MMNSVDQSQIVHNTNNSEFINDETELNEINNNDNDISMAVRNQMDKKYQMLNLKHFLKRSNNSADINEEDETDPIKMDSCRLILDENDNKKMYLDLNNNQTSTEPNFQKPLKSPRNIT